jgi:hypothetical protein
MLIHAPESPNDLDPHELGNNPFILGSWNPTNRPRLMGRIKSSYEIPWAFSSPDACQTAEQDKESQQDVHFGKQSFSFSVTLPEHQISGQQIPSVPNFDVGDSMFCACDSGKPQKEPLRQDPDAIKLLYTKLSHSDGSLVRILLTHSTFPLCFPLCALEM